MIKISESRINVNDIFDQLRKDSSGSIVIHDAIVRKSESGKQTQSIHFAIDGDAEGEMRELDWKSPRKMGRGGCLSRSPNRNVIDR